MASGGRFDAYEAALRETLRSPGPCLSNSGSAAKKMRTLYELGQDTGKSWQAYKRSSNLIDATEVRDFLQSAGHVEDFTEVLALSRDREWWR